MIGGIVWYILVCTKAIGEVGSKARQQTADFVAELDRQEVKS